MINYNEENTERANVSMRGMKVESWKCLKKLAAIEELSIADYIDKLVREELERLSK